MAGVAAFATPITDGRQCASLDGVGPHTAAKVTEILKILGLYVSVSAGPSLTTPPRPADAARATASTLSLDELERAHPASAANAPLLRVVVSWLRAATAAAATGAALAAGCSARTLRVAAESVRRYPVPLVPEDARCLNGVTAQLAKRMSAFLTDGVGARFVKLISLISRCSIF